MVRLNSQLLIQKEPKGEFVSLSVLKRKGKMITMDTRRTQVK